MSRIEQQATLIDGVIRDERSDSARRKATDERRSFTADEWNRLLHEFSHDMRTPLCILGEYFDVLREDAAGCPGDELTEMFGTIGAQVMEIEFLLGALSSVAKRNAGVPQAVAGSCPLDEAIGRAFRRLSRLADARGVSHAIERRAAFPGVHCNPRFIESVVLALGRFAFRHCDRSQPVVFSTSRNDPGRCPCVGIAYPGPGPAERHLAGLHKQLENAKENDCDALNIELGIVCDFLRDTDSELIVVMGKSVTELRVTLPAGEAVSWEYRGKTRCHAHTGF